MSTQTIAVHLPDGAIREVPSGTTPFDIANAISPRLAAACVVARITPVAAPRTRPPQPMARLAKRPCTPPKTQPARALSTLHTADCRRSP